jgi:hypothetical protein
MKDVEAVVAEVEETEAHHLAEVKVRRFVEEEAEEEADREVDLEVDLEVSLKRLQFDHMNWRFPAMKIIGFLNLFS